MNYSRKTATIFRKMCLPLFFLMIIQSLTFYLVTVYGNVVSTLNRNSVDIVSERVINRSNEIESTFNSQWGNMDYYSNALNDLYAKYTGVENNSLFGDTGLKKQYIKDAAPTLYSMIRNNSVNGVFIILANSESETEAENEDKQYYGLCIRDYDPTSSYTDKEDLLIERCPTSLTSEIGCPLDAYWEALYTFNNNQDTGDYFYQPLRVAYDNPGVESDNCAYLCGTHSYQTVDRKVVSYSMPLIASNGDVYGVIGVELTIDYLSTFIPGEELLGSNDGAYMLVQYDEGESDIKVITSDGSLYQRTFGDEESFVLDMSSTMSDYKNTYSYTGKKNFSVCCNFSDIDVYNRNTPFDNEHFALVGIASQEKLFEVSTQIRRTLLYVTILTLVIGFAGIFFVSHRLSKPVQKLAKKVKNMGPAEDARLGHINIREIDQLVDAIENQSQVITKSKVRSEFFSRMSHDMRTPMNAIIGFSSNEMTEDCNKEQLMEYLGKINGSGRYLLGLINEVLDMTKIDSGRMELEAKDFDLDALWNDIIPMIDELAAQKEINFVKKINLTANNSVVGDMQRMSQVFVNLLSNAVKFTPVHGTVSLTVMERKLVTGQISCKAVISDTGIGMSQEFMKKLYEPFSQEHPNREGTGLGLSIAHQLVGLMGGTIKCESQPGKGTSFFVDIALPSGSQTEKDNKVIKDFSEEQLDAILSGKRILLCEDHPMNRQIAGRLLEKKNVNVDMAENGKIGLDKFINSELNYYDAVLMDIRMPVMTGLEAAKAIRQLEREDAHNIPILAMTANAFQDDIEASKKAGMNAHLSKPIEPPKLYKELAKYISKEIIDDNI